MYTIKLSDKNIQSSKTTLNLIPYFKKIIMEDPNNKLFDVNIPYDIFMQILDHVSFNMDIDYEMFSDELLMLGLVDAKNKIAINVRGKIFYCDESVLKKFRYFESLISDRWNHNKIFLDINPEAFQDIIADKYYSKWKNIICMLCPKDKILYQNNEANEPTYTKIFTTYFRNLYNNELIFDINTTDLVLSACLDLDFDSSNNSWIDNIETYIIKNININHNKLSSHILFIENSKKNIIHAINTISIPINIMSSDVKNIKIELNNYDKLKTNKKNIKIRNAKLSVQHTNDLTKLNINMHWIHMDNCINNKCISMRMYISDDEVVNKIIILVTDSDGKYLKILDTILRIEIMADCNSICDSSALSLLNISGNNFVRNHEYILVCHDSDIPSCKNIDVKMWLIDDYINEPYMCHVLLQVVN